MQESRTISISIARGWKEVYQSVWRPQDFPRWASGLSKSPLERAEGEWWRTEGSGGPIRIRFSYHNAFGVMDHYVNVGVGADIYIPMRIVENGQGAEVLFTLFRQPEMSDEKFAADANWVKRDLLALKGLIDTL
jgi:hypothetical protein